MHTKATKRSETSSGRFAKPERNENTGYFMFCTAMREKDRDRTLPEQLIVEAMINDQVVRALVDTGSLMDFTSTRLVDQLKIKTDIGQACTTIHGGEGFELPD